MDVLKFECSDYQITVSTASVNYAWDRFVRRVKMPQLLIVPILQVIMVHCC